MLTALAIACAGTACAQPWLADIQSLVETEKAFAAASAREGVKRAFLSYLAEGSVLFRPHPVNGRQVWAARPDPPFLLSWYPSHAEISSDGRLGFTTGPSVLTDTSGGGRRDWHGHFVTVWKRGGDTAWKVVLDAGVGHEEILPPPPMFDPARAPRRDSGTVPTGGSSLDTVLARERSCGEIAENSGLLAAYAKYARHDIRVYREGSTPSLGVPNPDSASGTGGLRGHLEPISGDIAASKDMAYIYGKFTASAEATAPTAYYVRIWTLEWGKDWEIALELWLPVPPPK